VPCRRLLSRPLPSPRLGPTARWPGLQEALASPGLIAGGVFTALALSNFSSTASQYNRDDQNAGKTYAALQWVGYGLGAAGIGTANRALHARCQAKRFCGVDPDAGQGFAGASVAGTYWNDKQEMS